jgi:dihydrofolate synthase/folylpolyglutamate synthase
VIADVAHNLHGISHAIDEISNLFPRKRITCVFGVLADKDYLAMIELLNEYVDDYVAVSPDQHRALSAVELTKAIHASGKNAIAAESVLDGLETAITNSNSDDVVCILGSHYNLENVLKHYKSS